MERGFRKLGFIVRGIEIIQQKPNVSAFKFTVSWNARGAMLQPSRQKLVKAGQWQKPKNTATNCAPPPKVQEEVMAQHAPDD